MSEGIVSRDPPMLYPELLLPCPAVPGDAELELEPAVGFDWVFPPPAVEVMLEVCGGKVPETGWLGSEFAARLEAMVMNMMLT